MVKHEHLWVFFLLRMRECIPHLVAQIFRGKYVKNNQSNIGKIHKDFDDLVNQISIIV